MSFSGAHSRARNRRGQPTIDLTPLIDVVFQLLIFFVLTSTFQQDPSFRVKLPVAKNQEITQEPKAVVVVVSREGELEVDGQRVDERELQLRVCAAVQAEPTTAVNIKADQATEHQNVVKVFDIAKSCGAERLGILHGR